MSWPCAKQTWCWSIWLVFVDLVKAIAERKAATPARVTPAWVPAQRPWIVPITRTTKLHRLEGNLGAVAFELTISDLSEISAAASKIQVQGERLHEAASKMTGR